MDTNTDVVLARVPSEADKTTEPVLARPTAQPKIHHFTAYGTVSRDDVAAFAAAKVLLESAIAAQRKVRRRTWSIKAGADRRHYIVRLMSSGATPTNSVDADLDPESSLLGTMSIQHLNPGECAQYIDIKEAQTRVLVAVCPAQRGSVEFPSNLAGRARGIFDFTVVNGNVTHCVWAVPQGRDNVAK